MWSGIANGYGWQRLTTSFITLSFKFDVIILNIDDTLNTFHMPFWLEEKRWFVAYRDDFLFSIPHFLPDHRLI
jgi:hypothetical protein